LKEDAELCLKPLRSNDEEVANNGQEYWYSKWYCSIVCIPKASIDLVTQTKSLLVFEKLPFSRPSTFGHLGFW